MLLFFFVPFWCLVFDMFWCCAVLDLVISTYFNHVNGAKCLIHINLCTESDLFPFIFSCIYKKNSTRLQWYSCARYKAPGPLVYLVTTLTLNFDLLLRNFNIGHKLNSIRGRVSHFTCVFFMIIPFTWHHKILPWDLDFDLWPSFEKL